jgi:2-deoxy-D-gluconate 3-dehydrogenase
MNTLDHFQLSGKTAVVTGCKRGIGKAMAIGLAEAGADIVGVSASLEASGSEIEKEVTALGRSFCAYQCDFADREKLYEFVGQVKATCQRSIFWSITPARFSEHRLPNTRTSIGTRSSK